MKKKPFSVTKELDGSYAFDMLDKENAVISATECTGLMPTPPQDSEEAESYNEIYVVPKVVNEGERSKMHKA